MVAKYKKKKIKNLGSCDPVMVKFIHCLSEKILILIIRPPTAAYARWDAVKTHYDLTALWTTISGTFKAHKKKRAGFLLLFLQGLRLPFSTFCSAYVGTLCKYNVCLGETHYDLTALWTTISETFEENTRKRAAFFGLGRDKYLTVFFWDFKIFGRFCKASFQFHPFS